MIWSIVLLIVGFVILVKGADFLVLGASSVAKKLKVSNLVIGLTVVAFGTSTPELFVSIIASLGGSNEIAINNIIGSNIANILLILGVTALIFPLKVVQNTSWKEIPFSLLSVVLLFIFVNDTLFNNSSENLLTFSDGFVFLCFFIIFLYYVFGIAKEGSLEEDEITKMKDYSTPLAVLMIILGLLGLGFGGKWIIDGAIEIARYYNVSDTLIGLTLVAIGTSLPELATSVVAAYRKNADIAVANVVGSNIFNVFWILGLNAIISPIPAKKVDYLNFDIGISIGASFLLFVFMFSGKRYRLDRWEGALFLVSYAGYMIYIIYRG